MGESIGFPGTAFRGPAGCATEISPRPVSPIDGGAGQLRPRPPPGGRVLLPRRTAPGGDPHEPVPGAREEPRVHEAGSRDPRARFPEARPARSHGPRRPLPGARPVEARARHLGREAVRVPVERARRHPPAGDDDPEERVRRQGPRPELRPGDRVLDPGPGRAAREALPLEVLRGPRELHEGLLLHEMEFAGDHETVEGATEVDRDEVPRPARDDPRRVRARPADRTDERVRGERLAFLLLRDVEEVPDRLTGREELAALREVEEDEGVETALPVLVDHLKRGRGTELLVGEGDRRRAAELVDLEAEEAGGRAHDARAVDDPAADPRLVRPHPELGVGCRRHRIAGDEEGRGPVAGGLEDLGPLLDVLAGEDADRLAHGELQGLDGRPAQARRVELREDGVRGPGGLDALHGDVLLVEEAEADEDEFPHRGEPICDPHKYVRGGWKLRYKVGGNGGRVRSLSVEVPTPKGEEVRRKLVDTGLLRKELRIERAGAVLHIPVVGPTGLPFPHREREFQEGVPSVRSYRDLVDVPPRLAPLLPKAFDAIGDIIVLRLPDELTEYAQRIGEAILRWNPKVRTVAVDEGVSGELRVRRIRVVAGEPKTRTEHVEFGLRYPVAVEHGHFSPRRGPA